MNNINGNVKIKKAEPVETKQKARENPILKRKSVTAKLSDNISNNAYMFFIVHIQCEAYHSAKMKFSTKDFFSNCDQIQNPDLVTFNDKILHGKLYFLCSDMRSKGC